MLKKIIILFFVTTPLGALANESTQKLGASALSMVQDLRKMGVQNVGDLKLRDLEERMRLIEWKWISGLPPKKIAGERRSAFYLRRENRIFVSTKISSTLTQEVPQLELHEALGASEVNDEEYVFSTALHMIHQAKDKADREKLRNGFGRSLFTKRNLYRGGSGVGGGGDIHALEVKNRVLAEIKKGRVRPSLDFYLKYPLISFEPFYDDKRFVGLEYELRTARMIEMEGARAGVPIERGSQEIVKIYFPVKVWKAAESSRKIIVKMVANGVIGIFPLTDSSKVQSRVPPNCPSSLKVKYPVPVNDSIRLIQDYRSSILMGCQNQYGLDTPGFRLRVPSWKD